MIEEDMNLAVFAERSSTLAVLKIIIRAEEDRTHLERGYSSLHDWLISAHRYSEGAANRRVQAARMLRLISEDQFLDGTFTLTTLAMAYSASKGQVDKERSSLLKRLAGKSGREAEKILARLYPEKPLRESAIPIDGELSRLSVNVPTTTVEKLLALRDEMSHKLLTIGQVIVELVAEKRCVTANCTFQDPKTKRVCGSSFLVQKDHIHPKGLGGSDRPENRRDLCRAHNILVAEHAYGKEFMKQWKAG
jgi:hypothetical protein